MIFIKRRRFLAARTKTKTCPHCHSRFTSTAGQQRYCKRPACAAERKYDRWTGYIEKWRKNHPGYWAAYMRRWHRAHPDYYQEWRKKHPDYYRNWYLRRKTAMVKSKSAKARQRR